MKKFLLTIATMAIIATGCQHQDAKTSGIDTNNFDTTAGRLLSICLRRLDEKQPA
jgi:hypothetical protein